MRVQLTRDAARRDERGAVAVIVALLMIPMLVLSAFAIDFGNSYSQSRALSTGADSAALAVLNEAKAVNLIEACAGEERPWLFSVNMYDPHHAFDPPEDFLAVERALLPAP